MSQQDTYRLEFFVNLFNNLFHRKNVIVLVGKTGITFSALKKHKVISSIFVDSKDADFQKKYRKFFKKYKNYHIVFLLDDKNCVLKHEIMTILGSIIKSNPVENFIQKNYHPEDIVAHNVYEVTTQNGEVWNTCIASMPFIFPINELLEYVINNSFKYSGIYFLSLEFETIIERILQKTQNTECTNHLQIFATITRASDIRIAVKYKKNIMDEQMIEYPKDKSDMYVQGTIEQTITDKLIYYKSFIEKLNLQTCVITLSDKKLKNLLSTLEFENCKTIAIAGEDITVSKSKKSDRFQDNILLEIFDNFNTHLALNKPLKSITKLSLINIIVFKPLLAIMFGICVTLSAIKYKSIMLQNETTEFNQEYYLLSEKYRDIQKRHPKLKNATDLIELYNLENIISKTTITPFDHIKSIFSFDSENLKIKKMYWAINDPQNITLLNNKLNVTIDYQYEGPRHSALHGIEIVNGYANRLKSIFPKQNLKYERNPDDITEIAKKVIIPAKITFEGTIEAEKDAR